MRRHPRILLLCGTVLLASFLLESGRARAGQMTDILISNSALNRIDEYAPDGSFVGTFIPSTAGLVSPTYMSFGPDGNLYVQTANDTMEFNGATGAFIRDTGLTGSLHFAPDGSVYQVLFTQNLVERVDLATGAVLQTYSSMLQNPNGLTFAPNGDLLVANAYGSPYGATITEINPTTGAASTFSTGSGEPWAVAAGPDGRYYVANGSFGNGGPLADTVSVVGASGGPASLFTSLGTDGNDVAFDGSDLFVVSYYSGQLFRIDGSTGAIENTFQIADGSQLYGLAVRPAEPATVPEPSSLVFGCLGVFGVLTFARRTAVAQRSQPRRGCAVPAAR